MWYIGYLENRRVDPVGILAENEIAFFLAMHRQEKWLFLSEVWADAPTSEKYSD